MSLLPAPCNGISEAALHAAQAGAAALHRGSGTIASRMKTSPGDIVTDFDERAEKAIRAVLMRERPDDAIVGEEGGLTEGSSGIEWFVDPIDGTTNFAQGLPYYAVSVAAYDTTVHDWVAAAVIAPALRRTYTATRGRGAWVEDEQRRRQLKLPNRAASPLLLATGLSYDAAIRAQQLPALTEASRSYDDIRAIGSAALALCSVAEGSVSAYAESDLYTFDWAAGALIAEEAGAIVSRHYTRRGPLMAVAPGAPVPEALAI